MTKRSVFFLSKFILLAIFLIEDSALTQANAASRSAISLDFKKIVIGTLKEADHDKFINFFVSAFEETYRNFTLEKLGKTDYASKKEWLSDVAKKEVEGAIACKDECSHYLLFYRDDGTIVGYASLHSEQDGKVVYLSQACINQDFWWGDGVIAYVVKEIIPLYTPKAICCTLMVRTLNKHCIKDCDKLGFTIDETGELAEQHKYDPKHYLGMVKNIK